MEIEIKGVSKAFGKVQALKRVNLSVQNGMFGLLGPNGAGKTTLMRIMTTLLSPDEGEITIGNIDITKNPYEIKKHIGYLPQDFGLYKNLNPVELLEYIAMLKGMKATPATKSEIAQILELVNLGAVKKRRIRGFSGGMRQRLGIAQALLGNPSVLIVDEPTAGLDPEERIRFRNLLIELSRNKTVLLSTHILADIESSCNDVAILKQGVIEYKGTVSGLIQSVTGMVWQMDLNFERYNEFMNQHTVTSVKRTKEGVTVRFISNQAEAAAVQVEACLEDGYVYIMGGNAYAENI